MSAPAQVMNCMDAVEFYVRINGLTLPPEAKARIEAKIQQLVKREIASLDLKGDLTLSRHRMYGGRAGMVVDWKLT